MGDLSEVMFLTPLANEIDWIGSNRVVQNLLVPRNQLYEKLASGEIDLAVEPELLTGPRLNSLLLLRDEFVCVVRKGHPVAKGELSLQNIWPLEKHLASGKISGSRASEYFQSFTWH